MIKQIPKLFNSVSFSFLKKKTIDRIPSTLMIVGLFFGILTIGILGGISIFEKSHKYLLVLLGLDVVVLLLLGVLIAKKLVKIWVD